MGINSGKADKRGIVSTKKALDYLEELAHKMNTPDDEMQLQCIDYIKEVLDENKRNLSTQTKKANSFEKENVNLKIKLGKIISKLDNKVLIDLFMEN